MQEPIRRVVALTLAALGSLLLIPQPLHAQITRTSQDWAQSPGALDTGDSLREFQARLRSALFLLKDRPEQSQPLRLSARVTAERRMGVSRLRLRGFQILSDGGRENAEFELVAGSCPSMVGALGSAACGDFLNQAAIKGIPTDELEVVSTGRPGAARSRTTGARGLSSESGLRHVPRLPGFRGGVRGIAADGGASLPGAQTGEPAPEYQSRPIVPHPDPNQRDGKTLDGLREFLKDRHAASRGPTPPEGSGVDAAGPRNDERPLLRAHVKVERGTGIRHIRTDVKDFQVIHDYPRSLAGHNLGPVPEEHVLGIRITCLTPIDEIEGAKRHVVSDTREMEVEGTLTNHLGNTANLPTFATLCGLGLPNLRRRSRIFSEPSNRSVRSTIC